MNYVISDIHGYYDQFIELLDLIQDYHFYCISKTANGWMEKMENSGLTRLMAQKIYEAHTESEDYRYLKTNIIRFSVNAFGVFLVEAGGRSINKHFIFKDYGYMDPDSFEQRTGLEGAILKELYDKFMATDAKYVTACKDNTYGVVLNLVFDNRGHSGGLRAW